MKEKNRYKHSVKLENCPRCKASIRPPCYSCGHSLSGEVLTSGTTTCEHCGIVNTIKVEMPIIM